MEVKVYVYEAEDFCDLVFVSEDFGICVIAEYDRDYESEFVFDNFLTQYDYEDRTFYRDRFAFKKEFERTYLGTL